MTASFRRHGFIQDTDPVHPAERFKHNTRPPLLPFLIHKSHGIELPPDSVVHAHVEALRILHIDVPLCGQAAFPALLLRTFPRPRREEIRLALTSAPIRQRATLMEVRDSHRHRS
jgi:hypothetical protein